MTSPGLDNSRPAPAPGSIGAKAPNTEKPNQVRRHQYLILDLMGRLYQNTPSSSPTEAQSFYQELRKALNSGNTLQDAYPAHPLPRSLKPLAPQLLSLAREANSQIFVLDLQRIARRLESNGKVIESAIIYQFITQLPQHPEFPIQVQSADLKRAQSEYELITGHRENISFGRRFEFFMRHDIVSSTANTINQGGAILGLGSILFSFSPWRSASAAGIRLLSQPKVAAILLGAGGVSLYQQYPSVQAAWNRLGSDAENLDSHKPWSDQILIAGFLLNGLGIGLGATSFALGGRSFFRIQRSALQQGYTPAQAIRVANMQSDAVRRAVQDPNIWVQFARSNPNLGPWQAFGIRQAGLWTNRLLWGGSALVGAGRFITDFNSQGQNGEAQGLGSLLLNLSLDLYPAVTVGLYRAGRGSRNFELGPALSQELHETQFRDTTLKHRALDRIADGIPPLTNETAVAYQRKAQGDLKRVEQLLKDAQSLQALHKNRGSLRAVDNMNPLQSFPKPRDPVHFSIDARHPKLKGPNYSTAISNYSLRQMREAYRTGEVSPLGVFRLIQDHAAARNGAIFPRSLRSGVLANKLLERARQSERRYERSPDLVRPLEGIFVAVKDIFPGLDGQMNLGSKTSRITGIKNNPVVQRLLELGAIPVPVGMVAAANGGSGMHASFGYIPHPTRPGFDPAGSSSGTAHVVGLKGFPISIGIGTDTGGSVIAPAGAVGLHAFVPPKNTLSTRNMIPYDPNLDRVGVMTHHPQDMMPFARLLAQRGGANVPGINPGDLGFHRSHHAPRLVYLERLANDVSPKARKHFLREMTRLESQGYEVNRLGSEWDFISEIPLLLYPMDAYGASAFIFANPLKTHRWDPPRRTLDVNVQQRLAKGALAIRSGYFEHARDLSTQYRKVMQQLFGEDVLLASPSAESILTNDLIRGKAGPLLNTHDRITMAKNRIPEWGQINLPAQSQTQFGITFSGKLPYLSYLLQKTPPRSKDLAGTSDIIKSE